MDLWDEENVIDQNEHTHNDYKLIIKYYKTGENTWNYTQGFVYKGEKLIGSIKRNYSEFPFCFFSHYVVSGRNYMKQTFLDLDTGEIYDNTNDPTSQFCWSEIYAIDNNTLAAHGCFWGGGYEYKFYDVSDLTKGWPELKFNISLYKYMEPNLSVVDTSNGKITIRSHETYDEETDEPCDDNYSLTLNRNGDTIVQSDLWLCEELYCDMHHDMYKLLLFRLKSKGLRVREYIQHKKVYISVDNGLYHRFYIENGQMKYHNFRGINKKFELTIEGVDEMMMQFND